MTESYEVGGKKPNHCTCPHTFSSLFKKPTTMTYHPCSLTYSLDFESALTVDKEPDGFPLGKITFWFFSGNLPNGPISKHSSDLSYTTLKHYFSPPPVSSKGGALPPANVEVPILNSEERKKPSLKTSITFV